MFQEWLPQLFPVAGASRPTLFSLRDTANVFDMNGALACIFAGGRNRWRKARSPEGEAPREQAERLGAAIEGTQRELAEALQHEGIHVIALLQFAFIFVANTKDAPLAKTHRTVLGPAIAHLCKVGKRDIVTALAAYSVKTLWDRDDTSEEDVAWLVSLARSSESADLCESAWNIASTLLSGHAALTMQMAPTLLEHVLHDAASREPKRRCGASRMLQTLLRECAVDAAHEAWPTLQSDTPRLIKQLAKDREAHVRISVCMMWPDFVLCTAPEADADAVAQCMDVLNPLLEDKDENVQEEAKRMRQSLIDRVREKNSDKATAIQARLGLATD